MSTSVNLVGSVCLNNFNFTAFITDLIPDSTEPFARFALAQTQALQDCQTFEKNFTLGPITDEEESKAKKYFRLIR